MTPNSTNLDIQPIQTLAITPMEVPQFLLTHPDARVEFIDGQCEFVFIRVCEACQNSLRRCPCVLPEPAERLMWNRDVGLNQKLYDILNAHFAVAAHGTADTAAAPVAPAETSASVSGFLDRALPMAKLGIPCIQLRERTKVAIQPDWQNLATTDEATLRNWATTYPEANCGLVAKLKVGSVFFFESDTNDVLRRLKQTTGREIPDTLKVRSSAGKGHFYFRHTAKSVQVGNIAQNAVQNNDWSLRADNGYVCGPLSVHPLTGLPYTVVCNAPIIDAPDWVIDWCLSQKTTKKVDASPTGDKIPHGSHDTELTRIAGKLREAGMEVKGMTDALIEICENRCENYGSDYQQMCEKIAVSICKKPAGKDDRVFFGDAPAGTTPASTGNGKTSGKYVDRALTIDEYKSMVDVTTLSHPLEEDGKKVAIPPFDPSVMTGLAKEMTDFVIRGTTLCPQFAYGIAKTFIGARMASAGVRMEHVSAEPRRLFACVGTTGTGKGESFRRIMKVMKPEGSTRNCAVKFADSADSGAGLKDFFFEPPANEPVLCYIDEIESLGHKVSEGRNPDILDTILELADSTTVSRILANDRNGKSRSKTKDDARLVSVVCGQDGTVYGKAFGARTKQGIFDRLTPEYAEPVRVGDMPKLDPVECYKLLEKFNALPFGEKMTMDPRAKAHLDSFWDAQEENVLRTARFRKNLFVDAYITAMSRGSVVVELEDACRVTKVFERELTIRQAHFGMPIADRVSYYSAMIKRVTSEMRERLVAGHAAKDVAQTVRDYMTKTNAYRDNEEHIFNRAWFAHVPVFLIKVQVVAGNGRVYEKYLPAPCD